MGGHANHIDNPVDCDETGGNYHPLDLVLVTKYLADGRPALGESGQQRGNDEAKNNSPGHHFKR